MIMSDSAIIDARERGDIVIEPFDVNRLGPNSYDLTLGPVLRRYLRPIGGMELDVRQPQETEDIIIPPDGVLLQPNILYLAHTNEQAGTTRNFVPMMEGRSSMGRLGLFVHVSAGFGDVGFVNQWTLELVVVHPLRIYAGMRICQVFFHRVEGVVNRPYAGKYGSSPGAVASRAHLDHYQST